MVVCDATAKGYFDAFDGIHHQETQLAVKEVVSPHFIQRCVGEIVVANVTLQIPDTERMQVGAEAIIAYIFQSACQ